LIYFHRFGGFKGDREVTGFFYKLTLHDVISYFETLTIQGIQRNSVTKGRKQEWLPKWLPMR